MKKIKQNILGNRLIKLFLLIVIFVTLLSVVIYLREANVKYNVSLSAVFLWQFCIWSPWLVFFYAYNKIITAKKINKYIHLTIGIGWIATHYSWFFYYSSHFSPYLGAPDENYGVFRYFFIFWILIDILFLMTISVYFKFYNNKSAILSPLESTIQVKRGNKKVFLKIDSIYWISADGYYINIHSNQGQFLLRRALKDIFESLPKSNFIKIHRSAIININYLQELQQAPNKKLSVQMQDGNSHAVSKTHAKNLKDILKSTSV